MRLYLTLPTVTQVPNIRSLGMSAHRTFRWVGLRASKYASQIEPAAKSCQQRPTDTAGPHMPRLAANLAYLFTERPFMERFAAAAAAGFTAVELQFPYDTRRAR